MAIPCDSEDLRPIFALQKGLLHCNSGEGSRLRNKPTKPGFRSSVFSSVSQTGARRGSSTSAIVSAAFSNLDLSDANCCPKKKKEDPKRKNGRRIESKTSLSLDSPLSSLSLFPILRLCLLHSSPEVLSLSRGKAVALASSWLSLV